MITRLASFHITRRRFFLRILVMLLSASVLAVARLEWARCSVVRLSQSLGMLTQEKLLSQEEFRAEQNPCASDNAGDFSTASTNAVSLRRPRPDCARWAYRTLVILAQVIHSLPGKCGNDTQCSHKLCSIANARHPSSYVNTSLRGISQHIILCGVSRSYAQTRSCQTSLPALIQRCIS